MDKEKTRFGLKELVLLGGSLFASEKANAGGLCLTITPENVIGQPQIHLAQHSTSTDGYGIYDSSWVWAPGTNRIDMWSKVSFSPYTLSTDSRSADSTSNYLVEISGRELQTEPEKANMTFQFFDFWKENNFSWKNLIVELYDANGINEPNNLLGVFDAHDLASGDVNFPTLFVNNGLSYQIVVRPRNYADLNLDNKVNFTDKAILAKVWQNGDANSANGWEHYADIDRNHAVDMNDLRILTEEWLFHGCDPNTFVKADYINKLAPLLDKGYRLARNNDTLLSNSNIINSEVYEDRKASALSPVMWDSSFRDRTCNNNGIAC